MVHKRYPICFVAMAFGYQDTDLFYESQILPVLKRNQIRPIIINRQQSNDDLNIQIIEQLKKADFCIVDLTYARPSVYFEAGFAQRMIPVIYTTRSDHLLKGQPDDKRVHFDLQMKPLITWKHPEDQTFAHRLEMRIKSTFLREWSRLQKRNEKYENAEKEFQALPTYDRFNYMRHDAIWAFKRLGYANWTISKRFATNMKYTQAVIPRQDVLNGFYDHVYGYKIVKKTIHIATVQSYITPTKADMLEIESKYADGYFLSSDVLDMIEAGKLLNVTVHVLVLSINNISAARIENVLIDIAPLENSRRYYSTIVYQSSGRNKLNWHVEYLFVSGIKSRLHLKEELVKSLVDLSDKKHYPFYK